MAKPPTKTPRKAQPKPATKGGLKLVDKSQQMEDLVQPFLVEDCQLRGRFVRLGPVVETILARHDYPEVVARELGELLVLTATIGGLLKGKGQVTVQVKGDGLVNFLVADCTSNGTLRGYADVKEEQLPELRAEGAELTHAAVIGKGYLAITLDYTQRYQGIVELRSGQSLTEAVMGYFANSEQFAVLVRTFFARVERGGHAEWMGAALLAQRLPREDAGKAANDTLPDDRQADLDDQWEKARLFIDTLSTDEALNRELAPEDLLYRLFHEDGLHLFDPSRLHAGCRCSREKIHHALDAMGDATREEMYIDGVIEVICQFCKNVERFAEKDFS